MVIQLSLDKATQSQSECVEMLICYVGKIHRSSTRRVFGSQVNFENCFMVLNVPRVRLATVDRQDSQCQQAEAIISVVSLMSLVLQDDYAQEHESTTAFTTYSGVLYPPTESLPLMNYNSKAGILGLDKKAVSDVQQLDLKILFNANTGTRRLL